MLSLTVFLKTGGRVVQSMDKLSINVIKSNMIAFTVTTSMDFSGWLILLLNSLKVQGQIRKAGHAFHINHQVCVGDS